MAHLRPTSTRRERSARWALACLICLIALLTAYPAKEDAVRYEVLTLAPPTDPCLGDTSYYNVEAAICKLYNGLTQSGFLKADPVTIDRLWDQDLFKFIEAFQSIAAKQGLVVGLRGLYTPASTIQVRAADNDSLLITVENDSADTVTVFRGGVWPSLCQNLPIITRETPDALQNLAQNVQIKFACEVRSAWLASKAAPDAEVTTRFILSSGVDKTLHSYLDGFLGKSGFLSRYQLDLAAGRLSLESIMLSSGVTTTSVDLFPALVNQYATPEDEARALQTHLNQILQAGDVLLLDSERAMVRALPRGYISPLLLQSIDTIETMGESSIAPRERFLALLGYTESVLADEAASGTCSSGTLSSTEALPLRHRCYTLMMQSAIASDSTSLIGAPFLWVNPLSDRLERGLPPARAVRATEGESHLAAALWPTVFRLLDAPGIDDSSILLACLQDSPESGNLCCGSEKLQAYTLGIDPATVSCTQTADPVPPGASGAQGSEGPTGGCQNLCACPPNACPPGNCTMVYCNSYPCPSDPNTEYTSMWLVTCVPAYEDGSCPSANGGYNNPSAPTLSCGSSGSDPNQDDLPDEPSICTGTDCSSPTPRPTPPPTATPTRSINNATPAPGGGGGGGEDGGGDPPPPPPSGDGCWVPGGRLSYLPFIFEDGACFETLQDCQDSWSDPFYQPCWYVADCSCENPGLNGSAHVPNCTTTIRDPYGYQVGNAPGNPRACATCPSNIYSIGGPYDLGTACYTMGDPDAPSTCSASTGYRAGGRSYLVSCALIDEESQWCHTLHSGQQSALWAGPGCVIDTDGDGAHDWNDCDFNLYGGGGYDPWVSSSCLPPPGHRHLPLSRVTWSDHPLQSHWRFNPSYGDQGGLQDPMEYSGINLHTGDRTGTPVDEIDTVLNLEAIDGWESRNTFARYNVSAGQFAISGFTPNVTGRLVDIFYFYPQGNSEEHPIESGMLLRGAESIALRPQSEDNPRLLVNRLASNDRLYAIDTRNVAQPALRVQRGGIVLNYTFNFFESPIGCLGYRWLDEHAVPSVDPYKYYQAHGCSCPLGHYSWDDPRANAVTESVRFGRYPISTPGIYRCGEAPSEEARQPGVYLPVRAQDTGGYEYEFEWESGLSLANPKLNRIRVKYRGTTIETITLSYTEDSSGTAATRAFRLQSARSDKHPHRDLIMPPDGYEAIAVSTTNTQYVFETHLAKRIMQGSANSKYGVRYEYQLLPGPDPIWMFQSVSNAFGKLRAEYIVDSVPGFPYGMNYYAYAGVRDSEGRDTILDRIGSSVTIREPAEAELRLTLSGGAITEIKVGDCTPTTRAFTTFAGARLLSRESVPTTCSGARSVTEYRYSQADAGGPVGIEIIQNGERAFLTPPQEIVPVGDTGLKSFFPRQVEGEDGARITCAVDTLGRSHSCTDSLTGQTTTVDENPSSGTTTITYPAANGNGTVTDRITRNNTGQVEEYTIAQGLPESLIYKQEYDPSSRPVRGCTLLPGQTSCKSGGVYDEVVFDGPRPVGIKSIASGVSTETMIVTSQDDPDKAVELRHRLIAGSSSRDEVVAVKETILPNGAKQYDTTFRATDHPGEITLQRVVTDPLGKPIQVTSQDGQTVALEYHGGNNLSTGQPSRMILGPNQSISFSNYTAYGPNIESIDNVNGQTLRCYASHQVDNLGRGIYRTREGCGVAATSPIEQWTEYLWSPEQTNSLARVRSFVGPTLVEDVEISPLENRPDLVALTEHVKGLRTEPVLTDNRVSGYRVHETSAQGITRVQMGWNVDSLGRPVSGSSFAYGREPTTWSQTLNAYGLPTRIIDPSGMETVLRYDNTGILTGIESEFEKMSFDPLRIEQGKIVATTRHENKTQNAALKFPSTVVETLGSLSSTVAQVETGCLVSSASDAAGLSTTHRTSCPGAEPVVETVSRSFPEAGKVQVTASRNGTPYSSALGTVMGNPITANTGGTQLTATYNSSLPIGTAAGWKSAGGELSSELVSISPLSATVEHAGGVEETVTGVPNGQELTRSTRIVGPEGEALGESDERFVFEHGLAKQIIRSGSTGGQNPYSSEVVFSNPDQYGRWQTESTRVSNNPLGRQPIMQQYSTQFQYGTDAAGNKTLTTQLADYSLTEVIDPKRGHLRTLLNDQMVQEIVRDGFIPTVVRGLGGLLETQLRYAQLFPKVVESIVRMGTQEIARSTQSLDGFGRTQSRVVSGSAPLPSGPGAPFRVEEIFPRNIWNSVESFSFRSELPGRGVESVHQDFDRDSRGLCRNQEVCGGYSEAGRSTEFAWEESGRAVAVSGHGKTFAWSADGRLAEMSSVTINPSDPSVDSWVFSYGDGPQPAWMDRYEGPQLRERVTVYSAGGRTIGISRLCEGGDC